jgi:hypothetical protein
VKGLLGASACKSYPVFVPSGQIVRLITMPHAGHEKDGIAGGDTERCLTGFDGPGALRDVDELILRQPTAVLPIKVMGWRVFDRRVRRKWCDDALVACRHIEPPPFHSTVDAKIAGMNVRVRRQSSRLGHFVHYVGQYMQ